MSIADPFTVLTLNETSGKIDCDLAPQYAMKVALRTLRDRCSILQSRVFHLEEENLHLRISRNNETSHMKANNEKTAIARERAVDSFEQGEDLWARRSQNNRDKPVLQKVSAISSQDISSVFQISKQISSVLNHDDIKLKEDSLEEISLREETYGRGHSSKDGDADEESESGEDNLESLELALKEIAIKMKKDQEILRQQQEGLRSALEIFKKFMKENSVCKTCMKREEGLKDRENKTGGAEESTVSRSETEGFRPRERIRVPIPTTEETPPLYLRDRICPLCEKYFHCSTPFETFNDHVLSHFVEEDGDEEVSNNYEIVT